MKISHCIGLTMCISLSCHAYAQLDSLKDVLKKAKAQKRVDVEAYQYYQIGLLLYKQNKFDSAIYYYEQAVEKSADDQTEAASLNGIGMSYSAMGVPDRSIPYYRHSIALYEALKDTAYSPAVSQNLAIIYKDKGLYDEALEVSFNSAEKLERLKPGRSLASAYNNIASIYSKIEDYQKSYDYYQQALRMRRKIGFEIGVGQSYNNIGELFIAMGQYDSALANLNKARNIREKINDTRGIGRTMNMIGSALLESGKPKEAKEQLLLALAIIQSSKDNLAEIAALNNLASANIRLREFKPASDNLTAANTLIQKSNTRDDLRRNLELRADLYRGTGDKSKLIATLERLQVVKDSLLNTEKIESMVTLGVQYETEKKEQEIVSLQQQQEVDQARLESSRTTNIFLVTGIAMLAIIIVLVYRLYRVSQKGKESAELNARETHHRTTNNLQMLISFFTIQGSLIKDHKTAELLKSTESRVNAMALIHKKLYLNEAETTVNLKDYIQELVDYLVFSYGFEDRLKKSVAIDNIHVVPDKAIPIGLVLNELISNALKYAYTTQSNPLLKLDVGQKGSDIVIELGDNGTIPFSFEKTESLASFGLRMVRSLIRELHGNIVSKTNNGTEYVITIPV